MLEELSGRVVARRYDWAKSCIAGMSLSHESATCYSRLADFEPVGGAIQYQSFS